ncbi:Protein TonB [uncultured bacterium]|nr:Protein TonB [uncultured bacterium]
MSTKTFPGNERAAFPIFLILSLLMHLGIWGALQLLPSGGHSRPKGERPPILVDVVDLPPQAKETLSPVKKPSTRAAQRDQSVKKETWPAPSPRVLIPVPAKPSFPARPESKSAQKEGSGDVQKEVLKEGVGPAEEAVKAEAGQKGSDSAQKEVPKSQPRIFAEPKRPSLFPTDDRIAELSRKYETEAPKGEVGKTLSLNTSELKYQKYLMDMKRKIEFQWEYPMLAARNGWQGSLKINFKINRDGSVSDIALERSSGYPMLDDAAMTAVRLATPFPPFPENFSIEDISIKGQFTYHLFAPPQGR